MSAPNNPYDPVAVSTLEPEAVDAMVAAALAAVEAGRAQVFPTWRVAWLAAGLQWLPAWGRRLALSRRPRRVEGND